MKGNRILTFIGIGIAFVLSFKAVNRFNLVEHLSPEPDNLGITNGELNNCPWSLNCVSTQATPDDRMHYIKPIALSIPVDDAHDILVSILNNLDRTEIETNTPTYLHATSRSLTMSFIDDVEFFIDEDNGIIQMRSAARLGLGDGGINKRRIKTIREQYLQAIQ